MPTWDFDTPGQVRLDLEIPFGRVEIDTLSSDSTHVSLEGTEAVTRELVENARVEMHPRGEGFEVIVEVKHRGLMFSIGRSPEIRLRVSCPKGADATVRTKSADIQARGEYGDFEVKTASGDVSIEEVQRDARIKTASGDVAIDEVGAQLQVQTASGDVAVQRVGGEATAHLVSGDVWIRDAGAGVHVNTVSGDQRIDAVVNGTVESHAVSGDVYIGIRRGSRFYVDANTISGSTNSELELTDAPDDGDAEAADDDAPAVEVRVKTVSGDIALVRAAAPAPAQLPTE
jgi:DUF4097 and DUF4098 domain-containing protein YvlB